MRRQCRNIAQITAAPLFAAHSNSIHGPRRNTGTSTGKSTIGETVENPYPALMESQQEKKRDNRQDKEGRK